jgi:hypothetical protein
MEITTNSRHIQLKINIIVKIFSINILRDVKIKTKQWTYPNKFIIG